MIEFAFTLQLRRVGKKYGTKFTLQIVTREGEKKTWSNTENQVTLYNSYVQT